MTDRKLTNGCTDARLPEWEERAWAHSVVDSTQQWDALSDNCAWILSSLKELGASAKDIEALRESEFLWIGYESTQAEVSRAGLLATKADLVVMISEYRGVGDGEFEVEGLMTHDSFWAFIGSFPNIYKHLLIGNGREKYWQRTSH